MSLIPKDDPAVLQPQSWWRDNRGKVVGFVAAIAGTVAGGLITSTCAAWPPWAQFLCPVAASAVARAPMYFAGTEARRDWPREPVCTACGLEGPTYATAVDGGTFYCWCAGR